MSNCQKWFIVILCLFFISANGFSVHVTKVNPVKANEPQVKSGNGTVISGPVSHYSQISSEKDFVQSFSEALNLANKAILLADSSLVSKKEHVLIIHFLSKFKAYINECLSFYYKHGIQEKPEYYVFFKMIHEARTQSAASYSFATLFSKDSLLIDTLSKLNSLTIRIITFTKDKVGL